MTTTYAPGMYPVNPNLPQDFPRPASFWADFFGVEPGTIRDWTDKYAIPYFLPGRERIVKPSDMMACLPYIQPGKSPPDED